MSYISGRDVLHLLRFVALQDGSHRVRKIRGESFVLFKAIWSEALGKIAYLDDVLAEGSTVEAINDVISEIEGYESDVENYISEMETITDDCRSAIDACFFMKILGKSLILPSLSDLPRCICLPRDLPP